MGVSSHFRFYSIFIYLKLNGNIFSLVFLITFGQFKAIFVPFH